MDLSAGSYSVSSTPNESGSADLSAPNSEGQSTASFSLRSMSGNYVLRKKFGNAATGIYTLKAVAVRNTGAELTQYPRKIGFFINRRGLFGSVKKLFLLVNPQDDTDVIALKLNQ